MPYPAFVHRIMEYVPDKIYLKFRFWYYHGFFPSFKNPKTLNEKITWLKIFDRSDLHTQCADKYRVREFVKDVVSEKYLIPLYFQCEKPENLTENILSEHIPCIIKTNNDSGGGIFIRKASDIQIDLIREKLTNRLRVNYYPRTREWQYKNIKPCIIVEKLLLDENNKVPSDYKFHCFNGKVRMIQLDLDRGTENHYRNWYNRNWEQESFFWASPKPNGKATVPSPYDVPAPDCLTKLIELSEKISSHFIYARVDWYVVKGKIFFGEITFHHDSGVRSITPKEWDYKLGSELNLSHQMT